MVRYIMASLGETFFTSIGCMDGRVQGVIDDYGSKKFHAQYPDTITEAGLVGLLAQPHIDEDLLASLRKKLLISIMKHHSHGVIVHGHQECAGNPIDDSTQKEQIKQAVGTIAYLIGSYVPVIGVFVKRSIDGWVVEPVEMPYIKLPHMPIPSFNQLQK
jgi:hypothetical protein